MKRITGIILATVLLFSAIAAGYAGAETDGASSGKIELYANRIVSREVYNALGLQIVMTEAKLNAAGDMTIRLVYYMTDAYRESHPGRRLLMRQRVEVTPEGGQPVKLADMPDEWIGVDPSSASVRTFTFANSGLKDLVLSIRIGRIDSDDLDQVDEENEGSVQIHFLGDAAKDFPEQVIRMPAPSSPLDEFYTSRLRTPVEILSADSFSVGISCVTADPDILELYFERKGNLPDGYKLYLSRITVNGISAEAELVSGGWEESNPDLEWINLQNVYFADSSALRPVETIGFVLEAMGELAPEYASRPILLTLDGTEADIPVSRIDLDQAEASLSITLSSKEEMRLEATVFPSDATDPSIAWASSNKKVAKVDQEGKVTAVGYGTCKITATAKDGSGVKASCTVTVTEDEIRSGGLKFKLNHKKKTATVTGPEKKTITKAVIPATVKANGIKYKVTAVKASAFKGLQITSVQIGKNVAEIGKEAFRDCKKLKTVKILTEKLTDKSVGANAFKGNHKNAVYKCPAKVLKAYKKWLPKKGAPKKAIQ